MARHTSLLLFFFCLALPAFAVAEENGQIRGPIALIPMRPGTFLMGSEKGNKDEKPIHKVTLTRPFYIGSTEVTQSQYVAIMGDNPSSFTGDPLPVDSASFSKAREFCAKLTEAERINGNLPPGMEYRLPTEAEWEYACRAGSTTEYFFGDDKSELGDYAWFNENLSMTTHPVGAKKPNAWGLYDTCGNMWEWCLDRYATYPAGAEIQSDPSGPPKGDWRTIRGGGWGWRATDCRSASRRKADPDKGGTDIGFRVVLATSEEAIRANEKAGADWFKNAPFALVAIPSGTFSMGSEKGKDSEKPIHRVTISYAFYMCATEITQDQYREVMNANPAQWPGEGLPIETVTWQDAVEFCLRLTKDQRKKHRLPEDMEYRLPTEAEWEYCCRAGTTTEYGFGDDPSTLGDHAWFKENSEAKTHPVGTRKPNAWGLFDMHGNVWEWCSDGYGERYPTDALTDPVGPAESKFKSLRGGCWAYAASDCRSAARDRAYPYDMTYGSSGFRCVAAPAKPPK